MPGGMDRAFWWMDGIQSKPWAELWNATIGIEDGGMDVVVHLMNGMR